MIQSITFTDDSNPWSDWKNTWDDWHIVPVERPVFAPPKPKTTYVDIPGGNGSLDLSESLTGYPVYENREGSFTFKVLNGYKEWQERYSEIMQFLHGKLMRAVLMDDGEYYFRGRFAVDSWESGDTWSEITISYNVEPFKWTLLSTAEPWKWDPFNFETGVTNDNWYGAFANIALKANTTAGGDSVTTHLRIKDVPLELAPVNPTFRVTGLSSKTLGGTLTVAYSNGKLGISGTHTLKENDDNFIYDCIFFGQTSYDLYFTYTPPEILSSSGGASSSVKTDTFASNMTIVYVNDSGTETKTPYFTDYGLYVSIDFRLGRL